MAIPGCWGAFGLAITLGLDTEIDLLGEIADAMALVADGAVGEEFMETLTPCSFAMAGVSAPLWATSAPTPTIESAAASTSAGSARVTFLTSGAESASASSIHSGLFGGVICHIPFVITHNRRPSLEEHENGTH